MRSINYFWAGIICLFGLSAASREAFAAGSNHMVFAHYMVCFATYGESVAGYQREIREAQAAGIDGFALNVGAWDDTQSYYKTRVALMYNAAEQLGTGFKLFFSVDFAGESNIVDMVSTYANRPASLRQGSKTVLSAYGRNDIPSTGTGGLDWTNAVIGQLTNKGYSIFFIPHFWPDPVTELPKYADATNLLARYGSLLDGLFLFAAAGLPADLAQCNADYTRAVHGAGKTFMASIAPTYWGFAQPSVGRRYYELNGGEGLILQWNSIITNQPDWVEITTWNDFAESTYVSPVDNPGQYFAGVQSPYRNLHAGYLELSKRYITWFKSGQPPATNQDALFYFYRIHPKDAAAFDTNDVPVTWRTGDVQDAIYTTTFLTAPATLEVASGGVLTTNTLPAGLNYLHTPFVPGTQMLTLRRNGQPLISVQGPSVLSAINSYNFFTASGYAYANGTSSNEAPQAPSIVQPPDNFRIINH